MRGPHLARAGRGESGRRARRPVGCPASFEGTDARVTPVLSFAEVPTHPHVAARGTITISEVGRVPQAAPVSHFPRTQPDQPTPPPHPGADTAAVFADWDVTAK